MIDCGALIGGSSAEVVGSPNRTLAFIVNMQHHSLITAEFVMFFTKLVTLESPCTVNYLIMHYIGRHLTVMFYLRPVSNITSAKGESRGEAEHFSDEMGSLKSS